ncbi:PrgH/EprH family type III secretion apparatus protein [Glaciimonas immobilis]|nr:PrgH/EprH family type III secretion apparatus protein [Glaciimonas immobilis]
MRLLSGPLRGCEYSLEEGSTLFVVGFVEDLVASEVVPELPHNTVVVPMPKGGINFEIIHDGSVGDGFVLRLLGDTVEVQCRNYQEICIAGNVQFSVKQPADDWNRSIFDALSPALIAKKNSLSIPATRWGVGGAVALLITISIAIFIWSQNNNDKRTADVASVISGSLDDYQLAKGSDGNMYVFAENERDMAWGRQALLREGMSNTVKIASVKSEEARINQLLQATYPTLAFHRLKLDVATRPVLILSDERAMLAGESRRMLIGQMMRWMPYVETVIIDQWQDAMLEQKARAGLDRLGITYSSARDHGRLTLVTQGGLTDVDLLNLQKFTRNYYEKFGSRYVHFSVELKDDLLKDKSFKYGSHGYIKMTPRHWLFPQSL